MYGGVNYNSDFQRKGIETRISYTDISYIIVLNSSNSEIDAVCAIDEAPGFSHS